MKLLPFEKNWKTINELLENRSGTFSDKVIYNFLSDGNTVSDSLTYGELHKKATIIASHLQINCKAGDRILLLFPQDLNYIAAFFGCLYAGMIAVPAYPPRNNRNFGRIETIIEDSRAAAALLNTTIENRIKRILPDSPLFRRLKLLNTDLLTETASRLKPVSLTEESIAFLQYTSGSTSEPKGVMVTHGNLIQNQEMIRRLFGQTSDSIILGWLPLYHDMGLIGNVLQPLYVNAECYLMTPAEFIQNPFVWLKAISTYRATTSGGPNFAYELCLKRIKENELSDLDLSCWKVAFNGAEPIRAATMQHFADVFKQAGFDKKAFVPCYGLAEATLLVSAGSKGEDYLKAFDSNSLEQHRVAEAEQNSDAKLLVNCGEIADEIEIEIVNPETFERAKENEIGEVWMTGASVAKGYWNRKEETEKTFHAKLKSDNGLQYLRTGDLGFLDHTNLFITGRIKDLIILNGRNLYPQDIEKSVEQCHPALRKEAGIAFGNVTENGEKLIIVHELEPRGKYAGQEIFSNIQKVLAAEFEISAGEIVLVKAGTLPKTSSGKKQRNACRTEFLNDNLEIVGKLDSQNGSTAGFSSNEVFTNLSTDDFGNFKFQLQKLTAKILKINALQLNEKVSLLSFGLDSLTALELTHSIKQQFKIELPVGDLLEETDFGAICKILWKLKSESESEPEEFQKAGETKDGILSAGQKSLWFLQQLAPENTAYHLNFPAVIKNDDFDAERLKQAFEKIALTHDSLRSTFFVKNGEPFRKIHDLPLIEWQENDFSNLSKNEIKELIKLEFQKPFDLVNGPLLRIGLWKTGNGEILLSLSIHHIIADFWSLALIVKQLGEFYNRAENETVENPETLNNYEQFVFEEKKYLESDAGKNAGLFWRKQLSGELPVLDLPFDFPRPPMQTFNGEMSHFKIDTALVEKLKKLSVEHETTLFTTLLTAYKILLHRYTNQSDIVVGTPTSGRKNYEYKNLVGYFVNPVAVRSFPETRLSFADYLDNVKKTFLEVLKNQNYPFLRVVENVTQTVDPSRSPVFQTMFILQQSPLGDLPDLAKWAQGKSSVELNLGKLKLESEEIEQTYSQFDLSMMVAEHAGEFSAAIQYNSDLFKRQTVERIGRNFNKLLKSIVENPHKSIAELDLLSAEEYEKVVFEWNNTAGTYDQNGLIHKLFEKQAEKFPQKIALSVGNTSLTYRELNEQANRFAGFLRKRGVTNEDRIAVYLNRSEKLIIALLGILKSGAAYVPLDTAYPKNRLSLMLEDSRSKFVITESLLASVPVSTAEVINIDEMRDDFQKFGRENLETALNSRNLAYIIYTSGSTGKPKGVAIEHRNVCALIDWAETIFSIEETKKVLASTSICFDLSVFEIFFTLSRGGEICLVENALELINSENISGITLINTVPSAMTELCRSKKIPETVETVNLAGEPLLNHLVEKVYSNKQVKRLYNLYGPSEDTTYSTFALMPDGQSVNSLIGKPIRNTQVYLLNEKLMPVPIGAAGEIYLGGDGVTRGYFNRSEITAEKFIPDNLSGKSGARLYKTNDLARFSENGDLIFLGRSDHQVKIRGYRIEPGEIETRIGLHPSVKETIVTAYTKNAEEKYIVGYIVPNEGFEISKSEIKTYLAEHLPEYMIPSVIVFLDSLPLTPNGKIDRKSLPIPAGFDENSQENYIPPRTPVEEVVVNQIAEILGRREIGIYSNFFENGGHSLSATQLAYRLRQIFQTEIPLKTIFEKPDAAGLAAFIGETLVSGKKLKSSRIEKIIERKPLRLSSAQKKLWFIEQIRPLSAAYNVSGAMRLEGDLDIKALQNAFEIIINRHDSLRTRFIEIEGEPFQIIEDIRHLNLEIEDRRHAKNNLDSEIKAEACRGFDLNAGKLIRVRLWRTGKNEYVLLLVMHHIITDGWSLGVLVKEIKREYERQIDGGKSSAEEIDENKILQYGDFAEWQISRMENGELSPHIEFWQKKLDGLNGSLELPTDYIRPAEPTFRGAKIPLKISNQTVAELKKIEQSEGVTLFMILLSALNILLSRYSGETDICIGVPVANRLHPETENIIGFFVNSLVIRTQFGTNETVETLIQKTRKNAIEAYSHQELPFDVLVENLPVAREISRNPIFQIAFALQNTPAESLSLPGVKCTAIEVDTESSKFDLTFDLRETENGLEGYLEYSTDIFSEPTITQMAKHFVRITESDEPKIYRRR